MALPPSPNAALLAEAEDIPLGSALEYYCRGLVPSAYAVYQAALSEDSPLDLVQKRAFAKDVLDMANQRAPLRPRVEPDLRSPVRGTLSFDD